MNGLEGRIPGCGQIIELAGVEACGQGHQALIKERIDRSRRVDGQPGIETDGMLKVVPGECHQGRHLPQAGSSCPRPVSLRIVLFLEQRKYSVAALIYIELRIGFGEVENAVAEFGSLELRPK